MDDRQLHRDDADEEFWKRQEYIYKHAYVSIVILALNVIIFVLCTTIAPFFYDKGALVTESVISGGEFYRIFTAMFLHANTAHLFNNMVMLLLVGGIVENYSGHIYYLLLYFLAGFFGNILSMAYELNNGLNWISIGASGAIMGVVGFLSAWLIKNRRVFLRSRGTLLRLLFLGIFVVETCFFQQGANTPAHLGGFLTGFVLGTINIVIFKNNKYMEGLA